MVQSDHSNVNLIKRVKSKESKDDNIADSKLVRCLALLITPLYALLKIYDLVRGIKHTIQMAIEGLFQLFIFVFCFGWFFNTPLFKMFKGLRCVQWLAYYKCHFHLLNIVAALLQAYFLRQLIPFTGKYLWYVCIAAGLIIVFVSLWMRCVHCFCILLLPVLASKHGRRFLTTLLMTSLFIGPIHNLNYNKDIITTQMGCITETARNTSQMASQQIKARYERMRDSMVEIEDKMRKRIEAVQLKLDQIQDKISSKYLFLLKIIKKINDFVEKCEKTMVKLKKQCHDAFSCEKAEMEEAAMEEVEVEEREVKERNEEKERDVDDERNMEREMKEKNEEKEMEVKREEVMVDMEETAKDESNLKKPINSSNDNVTLRERGERYNVTLMYQMRNSLVVGTNTSLATYGNRVDRDENGNRGRQDYGNHGSEDYYGNRDNMTLYHGSVTHLLVRRNFLDDLVCFFKKLAGLIAKPICNVIFGFISYLCKIPKLLVHFIDGVLLKKFHNMRKAVEGNLWLNVSSQLFYEKNVVEVRSAQIALEEFHAKLRARLEIQTPTWLSVFTYIRTTALLLIYVSAYRYFNKYLKRSSYDNHYINTELVKFNAEQETNIFPLKHRDWKKYMTVTQRALLPSEKMHTLRKVLQSIIITLVVGVIEGFNVFIYMLVCVMYTYGPVRVEHIININSSLMPDINITLDTTHCFLKASKPHIERTVYNMGLCGLLLSFSVCGAYVARWRHVICNRFYPAQAKARASYLHRRILNRRRAFFSNIAEHVFQRATEQSLLQKLMPWLHKTRCVLCNSKHLVSKCDECGTVYCTICLQELNNVCNVCNEPTFRVKSSLLLGQKIQSRASILSDD